MDLDNILFEVGNFGSYQIINLLLLIFPMMFTAYSTLAYVFTTGAPKYRCYIPECEHKNTGLYKPQWLNYAIPKEKSSCLRYRSNHYGFHSNCTKDLFLANVTQQCSEFIYQNNEKTIVVDFELECEHNKWKRTIVGTINNIGHFIGTPLLGLISDRFGRKYVIIGGCVLSAILGVIRSLSPTYIFFLSFEFLDALASSGIYSGGFVLGVEYVSPEKRVLISTILSSFYSVGEVLMSVVMWLVQDWRTFLQVIYAPGLLFILYCWCLPESMRWLLAKGKRDKVFEIIESIARVNKRPLKEETKTKFYKAIDETLKVNEGIKSTKILGSPIREYFSSTKLIIRLLNCSFCWITNTFVFYGLSLNSVEVDGNIYINFILVSLAEIPGYVITWLLMNKLGRRPCLFLFLVGSGVACFVFHFIPQDFTTLRLIIFLIGKMAITASFTVLYVFTTEIFPTNARHFLMGTCSTFGRIGSMVAPQTPLMERYVSPLLLFSGMSLTSGFLILLMPETLNTSLPDTTEEAESLGVKQKNSQGTDNSQTPNIQSTIDTK